jgi:hypothetical protein
MRKLRYSISSMKDIEAQSKKFQKPRRKNIDEIFTEFTEKIQEVFFPNFVNPSFEHVLKIENELYTKLIEVYNNYWEDKFQLEMMLVEIGDDSKNLLI